MLVLDEWLLTPQRVAVHVPTATAVLADVHLGYHSARRRRGEAVPVPPLSVLLAPLAEVLRHWSLSRIVVAGDLFEDGPDYDLLSALSLWQRSHGVTLFALVPGNHDRRLQASMEALQVFPRGLRLQAP